MCGDYGNPWNLVRLGYFGVFSVLAICGVLSVWIWAIYIDRERGHHLDIMDVLIEANGPGQYWTCFASPPRRDKLEEMLVRPWSGVICNIQCTSRKGAKDGPGGLEILDFFHVFKPENVQVMRGRNGSHHLGMAIIQFRNDLEGFKDAFAFEKYFLERKHSREHWNQNQGEGVGGSLYGWLARVEDYQGATFGKYLQATGELVELQNVTLEMEEAHEQMLAETLAEKNKEFENLSQKLDEANRKVENEINKTSIWKRDGNQLREAKVEMRKMQTDCKQHQELSESLQQVINERNSEVARLQACCNKLEDELAELEQSDRYFQEVQSLKQQLEKEKHRPEAKECIVCMAEFGEESDRQRSHFSDCHHANVCYGCASKMWKSKKRKCPSCNTPATEKPAKLPAKIFL